MTAFTPVATTRLAVTNASAGLDLTQVAGFIVPEKSGNVPAGGAQPRRPNMLRLTYLASAGAAACFIAFGAALPTAAVTGEVIIQNWPLQRTLRFTENFIAAITGALADTGTLQIEIGFGDPV
jgi:hypothetical protein